MFLKYILLSQKHRLIEYIMIIFPFLYSYCLFLFSTPQTLSVPAPIQSKQRYPAKGNERSLCGCVPVSVGCDSLHVCYGKLQSIDEHLRTQIRVIIWKQWKVPSKREWGLLKLRVPKWLAHKVANWGDHYQFVATKSVLARAVSKERLTKRGLVSLSDYYLKVVHI